MSEVDDPKREGETSGEPKAQGAASSRDDLVDAPASEESADELDAMAELDEIDIRELMRHALEAPPKAEPPDLLKGVQRRIRTRSRGKFYADGWSTARAPRSTYLVTSVLMLVLIGFVFLVLIPWGGGALPLP